MRQLSSKIWNYLQTRAKRYPSFRKKHLARLCVEVLEDRSVPTANASGIVTGLAFVDGNSNAFFDAGDAALPGTAVHLIGATSQGTAVNVGTTTNGAGSYQFQNVLPGTYHIESAPASALVNSGPVTVPAFDVAVGETVVHDLVFQGGLDPSMVSLRQFLTETTVGSFPFTPGAGEAPANYRPNNNPTVQTAIADISVAKNAADTLVNLAGHFSDPDFTNSLVTFSMTNNGVAVLLQVELFDKAAPQTVANFFDYVTAGEYDNSIFHRLATSFVLQGGALGLANSAGTNLVDVPVHALKVANEFSASRSNTLGTLAMAQSGGDPNSATNQFFFNLVNNASSLDSQQFAVFGKIANATSQTSLNALAATPTKDESATAFATAHPTALLNAVPLNAFTGATFPTDATKANYMLINTVRVDRRDEFLTYSIVSNDNEGLVTATLDAKSNELLKLHYTANMAGTAAITVRATDRYGASIDSIIHVTVANQAPTATVTLAPQAPAPTGTLTATAIGSDPESDPVTFTYAWSVNGATIANTAATLDLNTAGPLNPGDTITVTATPNDGIVNGAPATASVTVNHPPAFDGPTVLTPSAPSSQGVVTVTVSASDADSDTIAFHYVWEINGTVVRDVNSPLETDGLELSNLAGLNPGDAITVTITPTDGKTAGTPTDAATTVNFAPVVGPVTLSPTGPNNNDTLTASVDLPTDAENDPVTLTYVWTVNGATVKTTSNTSSITDTLDLTTLNVNTGDVIAVTVTPNDGKNDGAASTTSEAIANSVPVINSASLNPPAPTSQDSVAASVSASDFDNDTIFLTYVWTLNGTTVQTTSNTIATTDLLDLSTVPSVNSGDTIVVTVTPFDGITNGVPKVVSTTVS